MDKSVSIKMECEKCGHVQTVKGIETEDKKYYFGSSYDFCDKCDWITIPIKDSLTYE